MFVCRYMYLNMYVCIYSWRDYLSLSKSTTWKICFFPGKNLPFFPEKICFFPGYFRTFFVLILKKECAKNYRPKKRKLLREETNFFTLWIIMLRIGMCWLKGTLLSYAWSYSRHICKTFHVFSIFCNNQGTLILLNSTDAWTYI